MGVKEEGGDHGIQNMESQPQRERKGIPRMRTEVLSEQPDLMRDSQEIWEGFLKETVNQINIT